MKSLCVSIHDVSPHTLDRCERLMTALRSVDGLMPVTLLVIPRHYAAAGQPTRRCLAWLERQLERGHELALHGYTHRDEMLHAATLRDSLRRSHYTAGEGEFSALSAAEAAERLERGMRWFSRHGWPLSGFVAPAWLLSEGAWQALGRTGLHYTTTLSRFHWLSDGRSICAPTLAYSTRSGWRRAISLAWNPLLAGIGNGATLLRVGLHPDDALHDAVMHQTMRLVERLRAGRMAMTKGEFASVCKPLEIRRDTSGAEGNA